VTIPKRILRPIPDTVGRCVGDVLISFEKDDVASLYRVQEAHLAFQQETVRGRDDKPTKVVVRHHAHLKRQSLSKAMLVR
jgi:hypothetical protein